MKRIAVFYLTFVIAVLFFTSPVNAKSGCCSSHGGVCGCKCCDGTALSEKCAPYYPSCNNNPIYIPPSPTPQKATSKSSSSSTTIPISTPKPKPTSTPKHTLTLFPSVTTTPFPTDIFTPTLIPSFTPTTAQSQPLQGQIKGELTSKDNNFFSGIFKSIFNLFTLNFFSSKNNLNITPAPTPTPTITITSSIINFGDLQGTPKVLGETIINTTISPNELVVVTSVTDGDTIKVKIDGKIESVRLIGIDTPEVVDPRKPVQCFGKEASNKAKELLTGRKVKLESDSSQTNRDKYNRLLRYAWRDDGLFFNEWMIKNGYAHEYTYDFPYKYQAQFKEAEKYARENNLGLWNPIICITPSPAKKVIPTTIITPKVEYILPTQPTIQYIQPTPPPTTNVGNFECNCSKICEQISSCEEAYFQLNQCGCLRRDGDKDGIPCETLCR